MEAVSEFFGGGGDGDDGGDDGEDGGSTINPLAVTAVGAVVGTGLAQGLEAEAEKIVEEENKDEPPVVLEYWREFEIIGSLACDDKGGVTWLYRIAVNNTLTHLKRNRMRRFLSLEKMDEEVHSSDILEKLTARNRSDKPALMHELQEKLNEALQKLSLKHRTVVVLFEIEGLSHQEIAEVTKTSEGTVRSRLHYAKQQLQASLKEYLEQ